MTEALPISGDDARRIKRIVANVLGIEVTEGWCLSDYDPASGLAIAHYNHNADLSRYGHLRGKVVDTKHSMLVCSSSGYSPTVVTDELKPNNGNLEMRDVDGNHHVVDLDNCVIRQGFEGVVIRVFKHMGVVYWASHKKLRPDKSRWGGSDPFMTIYKRLGGPTADMLYSEEVKTSPWCYTFLLVDSKLLVATKQDVGPGYIVLLNVCKIWDYVEGNYTFGDIGAFEETPYYNDMTSIMPAKIDTPFVYHPPSLNVTEANHHLQLGYYDKVEVKERRLRLGEFIVIYVYNSNHDIDYIIKVTSHSYHWRVLMRDDNPNLYHRFYDLTSHAHWEAGKAGLTSFISMFNVFPLSAHQTVMEKAKLGSKVVSIKDYPLTGKETGTPDNRLTLIWLNFMYSVPPQQQSEVIDFLRRFKEDRCMVVDWLSELGKSGIESENRRINSIVALAKSRNVRDRGNKSGPMSLNGKIKSLIHSESGRSLFRMVKYIKGEDAPVS